MKRIILFAAAGLMGLAACNSLIAPDVQPGEGSLSVSVRSGTVTKADTTPAGNDAVVNDIQLFLFSQDGSLYRKETMPGQETNRTFDRVKAGSYDIVALVNAPELTTVNRKAELDEAEINLGFNDPEKGFLMAGQTVSGVTVTGGAASPARAEITVRRHVGRVRLTTVQNGIPAAYGALKVDYAFLENGFGTWNYGGTGDPSGYVNYAGRKAGRNTSANAADFIAVAADADYPELTFRALARTVAQGETETFNIPFYSLPNKHTVATDNFTGATSGDACARLVVKATYGEGATQSWYYPVTLENLERNKTYDVSFIIRGPGSPDPNLGVESGNLEVIITVEPWGDGGDFTGEF